MCSVGFVLRIVDRIIYFNLSFWEVGDNELYRINDCTHTQSTLIEVVAHCTLEKRHLVESIESSVANLADEREDSLW